MSTERTATINALTALLRVVDLGIDTRHPLTATQIVTITTWRTRNEDLATQTAHGEAIKLAKRVTALDNELRDVTKRITDLVRHSPAAALLQQPGIGPVTAAFASLAGISPIPASSGNTVRRRINHTTEGRTLREIRRCLKRHLTREIYRHLNTPARTQLATT